MYFAVAQEHTSNIIEEQEAIVSQQEELITDLSEEIYIIKEEASSNNKALKKDKEEITDKLDKVKKELKKKDKKIEKYNISQAQEVKEPEPKEEKDNVVVIEKTATSVDKSSGMTMHATYYGPDCAGCSGITATGVNVSNSIYHDGKRVIAVDPNVVPLGSTVEVTTPNETFTAKAADTGGDIQGNRIDILVGSEAEASDYGRHNVKVKILD